MDFLEANRIAIEYIVALGVSIWTVVNFLKQFGVVTDGNSAKVVFVVQFVLAAVFTALVGLGKGAAVDTAVNSAEVVISLLANILALGIGAGATSVGVQYGASAIQIAAKAQ